MNKISVMLDLSEDSADNVLAHLVERAVQSLPFKSHLERVALCAKALRTTIPLETKAEAQKHVVVRNTFQHAGGKVRERNLRQLGVEKLGLLGNRKDETWLSPGDVVKLSFRDLVDAKEAFQKTSAALTG